ncbi:YitT family protein [bacterium 1XD42-8]|nr:YitT family protein [Lachnospiraceae bacterium]RKJ52973.1 YitT family protein [bacterium 1XD42-8]
MTAHKSMLWDYFVMLAGTAMMAVAIDSLYDPMNLVTGGVTGLAILVKAVSNGIIEGGIPLWLTNAVLNVPLFLAAMKIKGMKFIGRTAFSTLALSAWLYVLPPMNFSDGDILLASVFGGILTGVGLGLVFLARGTTGGVELLATLIHEKVRYYSIVRIMSFIDGLIIITGVFVFGVRPALYAMIAIYIVTRLSDYVVEGWKFAKTVYVITEKKQEVANAIMNSLGRGVTGLKALGMYSGKERTMLFCVVSKKQLVDLKELVMEIDTRAFVIVGDAMEVLGEGFIEINGIRS